jgi:hypothetical protein
MQIKKTTNLGVGSSSLSGRASLSMGCETTVAAGIALGNHMATEPVLFRSMGEGDRPVRQSQWTDFSFTFTTRSINRLVTMPVI